MTGLHQLGSLDPDLSFFGRCVGQSFSNRALFVLKLRSGGSGTSPAAASRWGSSAGEGRKALCHWGWELTRGLRQIRLGHLGLPEHGLWVGYCTKVATLLDYVGFIPTNKVIIRLDTLMSTLLCELFTRCVTASIMTLVRHSLTDLTHG